MSGLPVDDVEQEAIACPPLKPTIDEQVRGLLVGAGHFPVVCHIIPIAEADPIAYTEVAAGNPFARSAAC